MIAIFFSLNFKKPYSLSEVFGWKRLDKLPGNLGNSGETEKTILKNINFIEIKTKELLSAQLVKNILE